MLGKAWVGPKQIQEGQGLVEPNKCHLWLYSCSFDSQIYLNRILICYINCYIIDYIHVTIYRLVYIYIYMSKSIDKYPCWPCDLLTLPTRLPSWGGLPAQGQADPRTPWVKGDRASWALVHGGSVEKVQRPQCQCGEEHNSLLSPISGITDEAMNAHDLVSKLAWSMST